MDAREAPHDGAAPAARDGTRGLAAIASHGDAAPPAAAVFGVGDAAAAPEKTALAAAGASLPAAAAAASGVSALPARLQATSAASSTAYPEAEVSRAAERKPAPIAAAAAAAHAGTSSGSAAPPSPSAEAGGAGAAAGPAAVGAATTAAPLSMSAAADAAERLLTALRSDGERAGYTLCGVPDAQLEAAGAAVNALGRCINDELPAVLTDRSGLWSAVLQVYGMVLRDTAHNDRIALQQLLAILSGLLGAASITWVAFRWAAVAAGGQKEGTHSAEECTFGARLALALVRSDALQAHARALARRHQQLRSALEAGRGAAAQERPLVVRPALAAACDAVTAAAATLRAAAHPLTLGGDSSCTHLRRQLQVALIRALHASNVLEHLARLRMELQQADRLLQANESSGSKLDDWMSQALSSLPSADPRFGWDLALLSAPPMGGANSQAFAATQLRSLARQPCLQLYAGWRLAAHLCHDAGAQLFGMPENLMPVGQLSEEERVEALRVAATLWAWALWAPPDASGASGGGAAAAAQDGGASQPLPPPPLPYKPVHMVRLMCGALQAGGAVPEEFDVTVVWVCYRALLHHPVPLAEAEAMLGDVWRGVVANLRHGPQEAPVIAGRLLRLPLGAAAAADGGGSAAVMAPAVPPALPLSLRCALEAGLLRGLESHLRSAARTAADIVGPERANGSVCVSLDAVDLLLRRPGVWPAVLAHAPPLQVAALVVTLRKVLVAAKQEPCRLPELAERVLAALMEQAAAMECAAPSSSGGRRPDAIADACRALQLNQRGTDSLALCDGEAARAPPSLALLSRQGGCPAPSSPAAQQQRMLAVFAAVQWLPELPTACRDNSRVKHVAQLLLLDSGGKHYMALLFWLRVVAEECLRARWAAATQQQQQHGERGGLHSSRPAGDAAAGADSGGAVPMRPHLSASAALARWRQLLCNELRLAKLLVTWLAYCAKVATWLEAQSHGHLFDLLELAVAAVPEQVAEALQPGPVATLLLQGSAATLIQRFLQRLGRPGLWAALRNLGRAAQRGRLPPDWQPPEQLLADAPHLRPPPPPPSDRAPLPSPYEVAGVLPLCSYPLCAALDGESEADLPLRACARCRVARYCSPACQRAHWAAGHKAECAGGSTRG